MDSGQSLVQAGKYFGESIVILFWKIDFLWTFEVCAILTAGIL